MNHQALEELLAEIDSSLRGTLTPADRARLEQVRVDLSAAIAAEPKSKGALGLRDRLRSALEQLEGEHPQLTSVISKTLEILSDLGV